MQKTRRTKASETGATEVSGIDDQEKKWYFDIIKSPWSQDIFQINSER